MKSVNTCEHCKVVFYTTPSHERKFCSKKCFYGSKQVTRICKTCDKSFQYPKSKVGKSKNSGSFCSKACYLKEYSKNITYKPCKNCGETIRQYRNQDRICCSKKCEKELAGEERICKQCGKKFWAYKSKLKRGFGVYCSSTCHYKDHRAIRVCLYCGEEFERTKSRKSKYCSFDCARKDVVPWNKGLTYENLKTRKGDYPKCLYCDKVFYRTRLRKLDGQTCCCKEHWLLYIRNLKCVETICKQCKKIFWGRLRCDKTGYYSGKTRYPVFCSYACKTKYNSKEKVCDECCKFIKVYNSQINNYEHHFCSKKCFVKWQRGANAVQWRGGCSYNIWGHKVIRTDDLDFRGKAIYRLEHRLIVEKYIGRLLLFDDEPIVHLNGIPDDNRIENLYVFQSRSEMMQALMGSISFPIRSNVKDLKNMTKF